MKLPQIQYNRVSAPNANISSLQKATIAAQRDKQATVQAGFRILDEFANSRSEADRVEAEIGSIEDHTAHEAEHGEKQFYLAGELESTGFDVGNREEIPAHEVRPFLLERSLRESISNRSALIRDPVARKKWVEESEYAAAKKVQRSVEQSTREGVRFNLDRGQQTIEFAQSKGLHDEAQNAINALPASSEFKKYLSEDNAQHRELYRLNQLSLGGTYTEIQSELERLQEGGSSLNLANEEKATRALSAGYKRSRSRAVAMEGEQYFSAIRSREPDDIESTIKYLDSDDYKGVLTGPERFVWAGRLGGELESHTKQMAAHRRMQESLAVDEVQSITKLLGDGVVLDPSSLILAKDNVDELRGSTSQSAMTAVARFDRSMANYGELVAFQRSSLGDQLETLSDLRGDRSPKGIQKYDQLSKAYQANRKMLETDTMGYFDSIGREVPVLPPPESPDFPEILGERIRLDSEAFETNGVSSGPLRPEEADAFGDWLVNGDPQDLATMVRAGAGKDAQLFWEQVIKSGAGIHAVAGSLPRRDGQRILAGVDLREDETAADLKNWKSDAYSLMGQSYGVNHNERRTRADAAVNHHLATLQSGQESSIEASVTAVTGGLVEFNNTVFQAPEPGVSSDQVESWIEGLTADDLPIIRQGSREDVLTQLQSGGINLIPSGPGKYLLQRIDTGMLLTTGGNVGTNAELHWPGASAIGFNEGAQRVERLGMDAL